MKKIPLLLLIGGLLGGCAHKDLKAPCASLASTDEVPCGKPMSIGYAYVDHGAR